MRIVIAIAFALAACAADEKPTSSDLGFDGTCVNCHAGLSSGHVHVNYKLKCVDCHGGNPASGGGGGTVHARLSHQGRVQRICGADAVRRRDHVPGFFAGFGDCTVRTRD